MEQGKDIEDGATYIFNAVHTILMNDKLPIRQNNQTRPKAFIFL